MNNHERQIAIKEGERNAAESDYFEARPQADNGHNRHLFCAGFDRGYDRRNAKSVTDDRIREMVDRFLGWKLPDGFSPDGCIVFNRQVNGSDRAALGNGWWPVGTNLLTADQARAMIEHLLGVNTAAPAASN